MHMAQDLAALRTRVYIDGYNLYYGCLKRSPYKWLDLQALFNHLLSSVLYEENGASARFELAPLAIKYFTAPILKHFARADDSVACQARYHNALRRHLGGTIQIIEGYYDAWPARAHFYEEGKYARDSAVAEIWKLEEKQSDVALAVHAYSDALRREVNHVVLVTNDTDVVPALEMIREHTQAIIGLVTPTRDNTRQPNHELEQTSHWMRSQILESELAASQLPPVIRDGNRIIHKPLSWYPRPDLLVPIYEEAKRVRCSHGAALKWLSQPCERLGGRILMKMAESEEEAVELRAYMDQYARDFNV
jgi:6-hydroxy-3-succinoylpyridine 3-monooxygenase